MNIGGESGGKSQDFDLNLAPIIDCLTVLITFMLASASFLAIGVFDSSVAAPGPANPDAKPPAIMVEAELNTQKELHLKVNGKEKIDRKIASQSGEYDRDKLASEIDNLKNRYPDLKLVTLSATDEVQYLELIKTMEALKKHIPTILLGGF